MPNYPAMYSKLFRAQTTAIELQKEALEILVKAQQETEEMYIAAPEPEIRILPNPSGEKAPEAGEE